MRLRKRGLSLIKQGICERPFLKELLVTFLENEIATNSNFQNDIPLQSLYPTYGLLRNYMKLYLRKETPKHKDTEDIRKIKLSYIEKIKEEASITVPWLPEFFCVTELTDDTVSGWLKHDNELNFIKNLLEKRTKCQLLERNDENALRMVRRKKIYLSLAPLPINKHLFKLHDIQIFSCTHDKQYNINQNLNTVDNNNVVNCNAKMTVYYVDIYEDYLLPAPKFKVLKDLRKQLNENPTAVRTSFWIFVILPLINNHTCHTYLQTNINFSQDEEINLQTWSYEKCQEIIRTNNSHNCNSLTQFDIISNSCIVGETGAVDRNKCFTITHERVLKKMVDTSSQNFIHDNENSFNECKNTSLIIDNNITNQKFGNCNSFIHSDNINENITQVGINNYSLHDAAPETEILIEELEDCPSIVTEIEHVEYEDSKLYNVISNEHNKDSLIYEPIEDLIIEKTPENEAEIKFLNTANISSMKRSETTSNELKSISKRKSTIKNKYKKLQSNSLVIDKSSLNYSTTQHNNINKDNNSSCQELSFKKIDSCISLLHNIKTIIPNYPDGMALQTLSQVNDILHNFYTQATAKTQKVNFSEVKIENVDKNNVRTYMETSNECDSAVIEIIEH